ncbi:GNAT family N-acetyltransferase [Zongyangia hominis]|uniref:GNAT family N-acetyltransferase n=1 Tax=Zongyangia hominis TaxID=2763677 RepID=A0A926EDI8_9FIRM|nr:GNAT family N-acetyltransferase [Zongyangia hominis]MBC8570141.1 GNAT family N-acetyltransferase [Zongyangia hominis]
MPIRPAAPGDLDAIDTLYQLLFAEMARLQPESCRAAGPDRHFLEVALSDGTAAVLVAEEEGQVLGFALLQEQETPDFCCIVPHRFAYLMDLCVHPEARGRGLGSSLLSAVKDWARTRGLDYVELNVLDENKGAIRLYERAGFSPTMHRMRLGL